MPAPLPRVAWYLLLLLLVPIMPFVIWGEQLEPWIETTIRDLEGWVLAGAGMLALIVDILLPVPSSMVGTLLGTKFNWPTAVILIWFGLTLGAAVGFALARCLGAPLVQRMCSGDDQHRLQNLAANHGAKALVLTRALPVLAEATVLMFGAAKLPWRQFWPAVMLANLGLAIAYATLGWLGQTEGAALWALYASILIPLVATFAARWWWPVRESQLPAPEVES